VFWVISLYFNIWDAHPKSGTFLLGHTIYILVSYVSKLNTVLCINFREKIKARGFEIDDTFRRQYRRYNSVGTQLTVRLLTPADNSDPVGHFLASVKELFEYALQDVGDSDVVGITIQNQVNQNIKPIGISVRRKDQLSGEVIWSAFGKVSQSNSRFNALDTLVTVHSVKMPVGSGKHATKSMDRPLSVMAHLKGSIVEVKAEEN